MALSAIGSSCTKSLSCIGTLSCIKTVVVRVAEIITKIWNYIKCVKIVIADTITKIRNYKQYYNPSRIADIITKMWNGIKQCGYPSRKPTPPKPEPKPAPEPKPKPAPEPKLPQQAPPSYQFFPSPVSQEQQSLCISRRLDQITSSLGSCPSKDNKGCMRGFKIEQAPQNLKCQLEQVTLFCNESNEDRNRGMGQFDCLAMPVRMHLNNQWEFCGINDNKKDFFALHVIMPTFAKEEKKDYLSHIQQLLKHIFKNLQYMKCNICVISIGCGAHKASIKHLDWCKGLSSPLLRLGSPIMNCLCGALQKYTELQKTIIPWNIAHYAKSSSIEVHIGIPQLQLGVDLSLPSLPSNSNMTVHMGADAVALAQEIANDNPNKTIGFVKASFQEEECFPGHMGNNWFVCMDHDATNPDLFCRTNAGLLAYILNGAVYEEAPMMVKWVKKLGGNVVTETE